MVDVKTIQADNLQGQHHLNTLMTVSLKGLKKNFPKYLMTHHTNRHNKGFLNKNTMG